MHQDLDVRPTAVAPRRDYRSQTAAAQHAKADVIVAGAGPVGLSLGIALAQVGCRVIVAGRIEPRVEGRTVALLEGSVRFLQDIGVWKDLAAHAAPLRTMRIVDDTGSLFKAPPVDFEARDIGRDAFGFNIRTDTLVAVLAGAARASQGLTFVEEHLGSPAFDPAEVIVQTSGGETFRAALLAAADGRRSPARGAAGIEARTWSYPQVALTAILRHRRPHGDVSTEFHTREGPFTLVPLIASPEAPHRSSLVWVMSPSQARRRASLPDVDLAREVEQQSRHLLGQVVIEASVGAFPIAGMLSSRMSGPRIALAGEAAHAFPPIGAQGLNLGFRDASTLSRIVSEARRQGRDVGGRDCLDRYARARKGDVGLRTASVDLLNRALLTSAVPIDLLRGVGLQILSSVGPLRRSVMRHGLMPRV